MSSYAVRVLLMTKKNGSWCMSADNPSISKITMKYRLVILSLNDMLEMLAGEKIFSLIDLQSGYDQI